MPPAPLQCRGCLPIQWAVSLTTALHHCIVNAISHFSVCCLLSMPAGFQLEWSNCSLFQVFPDAPPQLLQPCVWPLPCTAAYHAVAVAHDVVATRGDFAAHGPHFVDWCGWAEEGVCSMAAVPLNTCSRPAGVLSLGSSQVGGGPGVVCLVLGMRMQVLLYGVRHRASPD